MSKTDTTINQLSQNITEATDLMKVLSSPARLKLMCLLMDGEQSAGELARALSMKPPAISQHLAKMRAQGLVTTRRNSQTIYYSANQGVAQNVVGSLCDYYKG